MSDKRIKILIVATRPSQITKALEEAGYHHMMLAPTGYEALKTTLHDSERCRPDTFSLVIIKEGIKDEPGEIGCWQLIDIWRKHHMNAPIIIVAGNKEAIIQQLRQRQSVTAVSRPVTKETLAAAIKTALQSVH